MKLPTVEDRRRQEDIAAAALVREIARAQRWCDLWQAVDALMAVRRMGASMRHEEDLFANEGEMPSGKLGASAPGSIVDALSNAGVTS